MLPIRATAPSLMQLEQLCPHITIIQKEHGTYLEWIIGKPMIRLPRLVKHIVSSSTSKPFSTNRTSSQPFESLAPSSCKDALDSQHPNKEIAQENALQLCQTIQKPKNRKWRCAKETANLKSPSQHRCNVVSKYPTWAACGVYTEPSQPGNRPADARPETRVSNGWNSCANAGHRT